MTYLLHIIDQITTAPIRKAVIFLFFILSYTTIQGEDDLKSLTRYLDDIIEDKEVFSRQKESRISQLKHLLGIPNLTLEQEYDINNKLYDEYKKFKLDSATYYMEKNIWIAKKMADPERSCYSNIRLAIAYSSSGKYRESEEVLNTIETNTISKELLADYYEARCMFFSQYSSTSRQDKYIEYAQIYRDSLMSVLDPTSYRYRINLVQNLINQEQIEQAENILLELFDLEEKNSPDYAIIAYFLGLINQIKENPILEKKYYSLSTIADTKNSIKENASLQRLALIYYKTGNIDKAFKYSQLAIEDAAFCNVQFRSVQMSEFYSIINASYREKEANSKKQLFFYLILISVLTVFLILLVLYVYKQMKKLSRIKEELSRANNKFIDLNRELNDKNELLYLKNNQLSNANLIKEQYIAQFFGHCSTYINKIEDYRRSLHRIAQNNQFDQLLKMLKSTTMIEGEFDELYRHFDTIFLNLYPTFISDFNALLIECEQIDLKSGDLLNKELRIYALLRLGINDSSKIATFLRCSLSTVYNYRTKIRNKASISREEFEDMVMNIGNNSSQETEKAF